ncbi:MAG: hypothetical protein AMXMBFR60_17740 [Chloroflexota bacterium]
MICIHEPLDGKPQINQFTKEQQGRAVLEFNPTADKTHQIASLLKIHIRRVNEGLTGEQIQG